MSYVKYAKLPDWYRISGMRQTATYDALARGDLKAIKLGGKTLIDVEHGLSWLASQPAWRPSGPVASNKSVEHAGAA